MHLDTRQYGKGTSVTLRGPWSVYVSARVLCPDGKVRTVKRIAITSDTFFSVPCSVTFRGRTVAGYMTARDTEAPENHAIGDSNTVMAFVPYQYRKNGNAFQRAD
jgi:hypothetical protein